MATKEEYLEKLKSQLASWDTEVAELEAKASEATSEIRAEIEEQIGNLRAKFREGELKFDEIMKSPGESWRSFVDDAEEKIDELVEDFKEDIEYATAEAKGLVDKVKSLFK